VQYADHPALHEQRHPEQRAQALLAQDRVDDLGLVDVLDRHRPPRGRDAAGEPAPHRDADPAFDLLLEALGGPCHERPVVVVEQQDGRGVSVEDRDHAHQKLVQEFFEREVRESRIRDASKIAQPIGCHLGLHPGDCGASYGWSRSRTASLNPASAARR
jgi:hypothetical protein